MHPEPFTRADVTARTEPLDPLDEGELRKLATVAGVARDHKGEFIEQVRAEIDHFRLVERARRQERPAAVAAATREALKVCERFLDDMRKFPASVRALILGTMNMSEPSEAGIANAKKEIARLERHVTGHREAGLTTSLLGFARTLQIIACQFAPSLKDHPAQLRHWLEEALIVAGIAPPGKNQKKAYFHRLMLKPEVIAAIFD